MSAIQRNAPATRKQHYRSLAVLKTAALFRSKTTALTAFQTELLLAMYTQQFQYRSGNWSFDGTIWSRTAYRLAADGGALRPSPAAGRKNMSRAFEAKLTQARQQLKTRKLLKSRVIRPHDAPAKFAQGYKQHRARGTDFFLTEAGMRAAEVTLRQRGLMAEPEPSSCNESAAPLGPVATDLAGCD